MKAWKNIKLRYIYNESSFQSGRYPPLVGARTIQKEKEEAMR